MLNACEGASVMTSATSNSTSLNGLCGIFIFPFTLSCELIVLGQWRRKTPCFVAAVGASILSSYRFARASSEHIYRKMIILMLLQWENSFPSKGLPGCKSFDVVFDVSISTVRFCK